MSSAYILYTSTFQQGPIKNVTSFLPSYHFPYRSMKNSCTRKYINYLLQMLCIHFIFVLSVFSQFVFVLIKTGTKNKENALSVQKYMYSLRKFQILCICKTWFRTFVLLSIVQMIDF